MFALLLERKRAVFVAAQTFFSALQLKLISVVDLSFDLHLQQTPVAFFLLEVMIQYFRKPSVSTFGLLLEFPHQKHVKQCTHLLYSFVKSFKQALVRPLLENLSWNEFFFYLNLLSDPYTLTIKFKLYITNSNHVFDIYHT